MHSNKGSLTSIEKLDYFVSWFGEFSGMEKSDFLERIAKKLNDQLETDSYNGNLTAGFKKLELNDRLPSIFKCRIQLFDQWFVEWSDDEREQLLNRIKNLDGDFSEKLDKAIETGKLPQNNLLYCSYEIDDETYEQLRKNHQLTNGNSLNSISSIDLLNTSNGSTNGLTIENGLNEMNGHDALNGHEENGLNLTNGRKEETTSLNSSHAFQNGHHRHSTSDEETDQLNHNNHNLEQEDSIDNQISSLETDNVQNGDAFNESIGSESNNDNL